MLNFLAALLLFFVIWIFQKLGTVWGGIVFGLIGFGVIALIIRSSNEKQKRLDKQKSIVNEAIKTHTNLHLKELAVKHKQLTYKGAYGVIDRKKWDKELDVFINQVLTPAVHGLPLGDRDAIKKSIDGAVEKYHEQQALMPANTLAEVKTGVDYEVYCADRFRRGGWQVSMTPASGDQGADLLAKRYGQTIAVQCKFYSSNVGNAAVQEVAGARAYYATDFAVVVSNAAYTKSAQQLAVSLDVLLLHHDQIDEIASCLKTIGKKSL